MIPKFLLVLVAGLFVAWTFNSTVGIIGLSFILTFYWTLYLRGRLVSRKKMLAMKDDIVKRFQKMEGKTGEEHFQYIYQHAHYYLNFRGFLYFAITNYVVKIGSVIIGFYSLWQSDGISVMVCVAFGTLTTLLSLKYEGHFKSVASSVFLNNEDYEHFAYTLNSYTEFFKERFPARNSRCVQSSDEE